jgi:hypothetical protein
MVRATHKEAAEAHRAAQKEHLAIGDKYSKFQAAKHKTLAKFHENKSVSQNRLSNVGPCPDCGAFMTRDDKTGKCTECHRTWPAIEPASNARQRIINFYRKSRGIETNGGGGGGDQSSPAQFSPTSPFGKRRLNMTGPNEVKTTGRNIADNQPFSHAPVQTSGVKEVVKVANKMQCNDCGSTMTRNGKDGMTYCAACGTKMVKNEMEVENAKCAHCGKEDCDCSDLDDSEVEEGFDDLGLNVWTDEAREAAAAARTKSGKANEASGKGMLGGTKSKFGKEAAAHGQKAEAAAKSGNNHAAAEAHHKAADLHFAAARAEGEKGNYHAESKHVEAATAHRDAAEAHSSGTHNTLEQFVEALETNSIGSGNWSYGKRSEHASVLSAQADKATEDAHAPARNDDQDEIHAGEDDSDIDSAASEGESGEGDFDESDINHSQLHEAARKAHTIAAAAHEAAAQEAASPSATGGGKDFTKPGMHTAKSNYHKEMANEHAGMVSNTTRKQKPLAFDFSEGDDSETIVKERAIAMNRNRRGLLINAGDDQNAAIHATYDDMAASKEANGASKSAGRKGTAEAHKAAATAHRAAAQAHKEGGNEKQAASHMKAAREHSKAAKMATNQQRGGNMSRMSTRERGKIIENLIANCDCGPAANAWTEDDRELLESFPDRKLEALAYQRRAYVKNASEEDDDSSSSEEDSSADSSMQERFGKKSKERNAGEEIHSFDQSHPVAGGVVQAGGAGTKEEYNKNGVKNESTSYSENLAWLRKSGAPEGLQRMIANAEQQEIEAKKQLVMNLIANLTDTKQRNQIGNELMRDNTLEKLRTLVALQPPRQWAAAVHNQGAMPPVYFGAAAPEGGILVNTLSKEEREAILPLPKIDYSELSQEFSKRKAAN